MYLNKINKDKSIVSPLRNLELSKILEIKKVSKKNVLNVLSCHKWRQHWIYPICNCMNKKSKCKIQELTTSMQLQKIMNARYAFSKISLV